MTLSGVNKRLARVTSGTVTLHGKKQLLALVTRGRAVTLSEVQKRLDRVSSRTATLYGVQQNLARVISRTETLECNI